MLFLRKFKVYLIMAAAFAMFAGVAYWYYKDTQEALMVYAQNTAKLETALESQREATQSLQRDIALMTAALATLNNEFEASRQQVANLERVFSEDSNGNRRDFGELAVTNPELVEGEINKGTVEVFNCIEILSGQQGDYDEATYIDCSDGNNADSM